MHFRTPRPCGMPKGDIKTSLATGREIEIDWHLGYPHTGMMIIDH